MKISNPPKSIFLAAVALAAPAAAQPQFGYEVLTGGENVVPWPTTEFGTPGAFKRIVPGEFAGNSMAGALALVGDKAVYLFEPAAHKDITEIAASGVNDIAALAPMDPGLAAGMILAKTDGLYIAGLNFTTGVVTTASIATGDFADLDLVRTGKIDSGGRDDIVGARGADVYVMLETGSTWSAGASFEVSGIVRDMVAGIDWNDDGAGDMAVLLDDSVEIYDSDGDLIEAQAGVATGGFLAHLPPTDVASTERLAWAMPLPSSAYALLVLSYPGVRTSCGIFDAVPASLSSAILVNDYGYTRPDLLTGLPSDVEVHLYPHRVSPGPYTAGSPSLVFDAGTLWESGDGPPAFGDITHDGIPDVIAGRGGTEDFVIVPGHPPMLMRELDPEDAFSDPVLGKDEDAKPWFGLKVQMPTTLGGYQYLQAMLWYSKDVDVYDAGERLEARAIANLSFPASASTNLQIWLPLVDQDTGAPIVGNACAFDEGFALAVRLVNVTGGTPPTVTSTDSPLYGVFSTNAVTLENMDGSPAELFFGFESCSPPGSPGIGYTPVVSLPPKRTNEAPSAPVIAAGQATEPVWE